VPNSYDIVDHSFDVIVLGAGGAGLRATLGKVAAGLKRPRHPPPRQRATRRGGSNHRQTDAGEPVENRQGRLPDGGPWVLAESVYGRPRIFADVTEANDRRRPSRTHSEISSKWWVSLTRRTQIFPWTMSISLTQQGFCAMRQ
jgi:hypothetical protein